jgi:zinc protease
VAVVGAGSSRDPRGKEGLAHLVEHLAFRAEVEPGLPMWRQLDRESAEWNAATTHDAAVYYQRFTSGCSSAPSISI